MLSDTDPEAAGVQMELLRRASISEKLGLVQSLTSAVVSLCKQGIRERHPGYSEQEVDLHFVEMNYGRELAEGMRRRLERDRE